MTIKWRRTWYWKALTYWSLVRCPQYWRVETPLFHAWFTRKNND